MRGKHSLLPKQFGAVPLWGWVRAVAGAIFGITIVSVICRLWLGSAPDALPFLIAPMGASAVLVFALPASPLAQPWPVLGGNTLSALIGITAYRYVPNADLAAGLAVGSAIAGMALLRCLHPPSGAVALTAVIGGPAIHAAGWSYALVPVGLNTAILLGLAWIFHNATRHSYPHRAMPIPPNSRAPVTGADIATALARYEEVIDASPEDLLAILRDAEAAASQRRG